MAIGESLKLKKLEQLFLSSLCDCVNDCFLVRLNWTKSWYYVERYIFLQIN